MTQITPFAIKVYALIIQIPKGCVSTYKIIAEALGKPNACQAVGNALCRNPYSYNINNQLSNKMEIPCHRVIASDGSIGGFLGSKNIKSTNIQKKLELLEGEGIKFINGKLATKDVIFKDFIK